MELQFQHHHQVPAAKTSKVKSRTKTPHSSNSSRFVGVRQRPSGRWVAEIKDTTQKIRMWLGTFETAEEAARAYDEAACLLRGTNTRTNFNTHPSADSPMASRIRNLLHHKKLKKNNEAHPRPTSCSPSSSNNSSLSTAETSSVSHDTKLESQKAEEVYRPCFAIEAEEPNSWVFESGFDRIPLLDGFELNKHAFHLESAAPEVSEFERMKVERQISASLYAMNGVQEYLETVNDLSDPLWDLPPLYQMCRTW